MNAPFFYGNEPLTVAVAMELAQNRRRGGLETAGREKIARSAATVQHIVSSERTVYGINTGFGPLCDTRIGGADINTLQHNLLISHSVGVGNPVTPLISRLMMIAKVQALAQGFSGISLGVVERILWHLEKNYLPVVPEKGSVGASGDLAPLAHLFLPLIGQGELWVDDTLVPAAKILQQEGLAPLSLGPKEGLALINGTQFIVAHAVLGLHRLQNCLNAADMIGAMSAEAFMGSAAPFDERLHAIRPHPGSVLVAARLRQIINGSEILLSHQDCDRVQDPYSIRCMPQVHGASRNAWQHLHQLTEVELNSVTDNPIVLNEQDSISGGNFHGQLLALPLDYATLAAAELGNISDRRSYLLLEGKYGLPKLLLQDTGLNSGFMIPQYTSAALVTENKTLCFPASADSIPTSLGQEDHVSMGSISGRKLNMVIDNLEYILAVELLYAAQALDFRRPLKSSPMIEVLHDKVRAIVPHAETDRLLSKDIEVLRDFIRNEPFEKF
jgi:histidine ammonia-lyase